MSHDLLLIAADLRNVQKALKRSVEESLRLSTIIEGLREEEARVQEQLLAAIEKETA